MRELLGIRAVALIPGGHVCALLVFTSLLQREATGLDWLLCVAGFLQTEYMFKIYLLFG